MNDEEMKFTVINDEGKEIECEILVIFENDKNGKSYILYTDDSLDEEGNTKVFASIYDPDSDGERTELIPIETDEEWALIETILEQIQEEVLEEDSEE